MTESRVTDPCRGKRLSLLTQHRKDRDSTRLADPYRCGTCNP